MIFLLFSLFIVTPKKTLGFFVTDKIYYSDLSNYNFKNRHYKKYIRKCFETHIADFDNKRFLQFPNGVGTNYN